MFKFEYYNSIKEEEWDKFIEEKSINGTFLHSRRFMNYHPIDRFKDASLMIYNVKNNLAGLVLACQIEEQNKKIFFSHKGTTFGGIIVDRKHYNAKNVLNMIEELKVFLKEEGYQEIYIKQTADIFSSVESDLFQYAYFYNGFKEYKELSTYVEFSKYKEDVISNFAQGKRTNVHNCIKEGLYIKQLNTCEEMEQFYSILCENLGRHGVKPVHTLAELIEFKDHRLKEECEFFGVLRGNEMLAVSMMFYFPKISCAHTQYLAAKQEYNKLSPMTFMYYAMICEMKKRGYARISWGTATEEMGKILNMGLITSKEDFGSSYSNNLTYFCNL